MPSSHVENVPTCFSGAYFGVANVGHSLFSMAKEQFEETLNCNVRDEVASKQRKNIVTMRYIIIKNRRLAGACVPMPLFVNEQRRQRCLSTVSHGVLTACALLSGFVVVNRHSTTNNK